MSYLLQQVGLLQPCFKHCDASSAYRAIDDWAQKAAYFWWTADYALVEGEGHFALMGTLV